MVVQVCVSFMCTRVADVLGIFCGMQNIPHLGIGLLFHFQKTLIRLEVLLKISAKNILIKIGIFWNH